MSAGELGNSPVFGSMIGGVRLQAKAAMIERVYIKTTFVSYLIARPSRDVVIAGHQQSTHEWRDSCRGDYELCASELVFQEGEAMNDADPIVDEQEKRSGRKYISFVEDASKSK